MLAPTWLPTSELELFFMHEVSVVELSIYLLMMHVDDAG